MPHLGVSDSSGVISCYVVQGPFNNRNSLPRPVVELSGDDLGRILVNYDRQVPVTTISIVNNMISIIYHSPYCRPFLGIVKIHSTVDTGTRHWHTRDRLSRGIGTKSCVTTFSRQIVFVIGTSTPLYRYKKSGDFVPVMSYDVITRANID